MSDWNRKVIEEFRANGGKVAAFGDAPVVILHTIGAKTGQLREIPLVALVQGDERYVFASYAGATRHPDWYHNLKAHPDITVETGTETFEATLTELPPAESAAKLEEQAALIPTFGEYAAKAAPRQIPAFRIDRRSDA